MPRNVYLAPHLSSEELETRYRTVSEPVESRRWHLLWLISKGWKIKQAALAIGYNYDYAKSIVSTYNHQGPAAMGNQRKAPRPRGKPALLNPQQLVELREALNHPPPDGGEWSGPKVAQWIAQKTGRQRVWPQRGWDYLKRCRNPSPPSSVQTSGN